MLPATSKSALATVLACLVLGLLAMTGVVKKRSFQTSVPAREANTQGLRGAEHEERKLLAPMEVADSLLKLGLRFEPAEVKNKKSTALELERSNAKRTYEKTPDDWEALDTDGGFIGVSREVKDSDFFWGPDNKDEWGRLEELMDGDHWEYRALESSPFSYSYDFSYSTDFDM